MLSTSLLDLMNSNQGVFTRVEGGGKNSYRAYNA